MRVAVDAVSLLRVSIALRSHEHYDTLKKSRCGRLSTEYRNKLGWLTGNLFSRVDTKDWSDYEGGAVEAGRLIGEFLEGSRLRRPNIWVPASWIERARAKGVEIARLPRDRVFETLKSHAPPPPLEIIMGRIREIGEKVRTQLSEDQLQSLIARLSGDTAFAILLADRAVAIAKATFGELSAAHAMLFEQVRDDPTIREAMPTTIADAVAKFRKHKGPREIDIFIDYYSNSPLFSDQVVVRIRELVANIFSGDETDGFDAALRDEKPSEIVLGYIRRLATEAIGNSLIGRMIVRLESDQSVRATLK